MFRIQRDADRATRVDLHEAEGERRAHAFENALRGGFELVRRTLGREHDKFVTAQARERIAFIQTLADGRRHVADQAVAEYVAVVVVDLLEVVQIQEQHADRFVRRGVFDGGADFVLDRVAVREPGERVGVRQFREAFLREPFLGDVGA